MNGLIRAERYERYFPFDFVRLYVYAYGLRCPGKMKRIPYNQMIMGLDQLFMGGKISNQEEAERRADTIDAYIEGCGWDWDSILDYIGEEYEKDTVRGTVDSSGTDVRKDIPGRGSQSN